MSRSGNFDRGGAIGVAPGAAEYALVLQAGSALDGKLVVPLADFLLGAECLPERAWTWRSGARTAPGC